MFNVGPLTQEVNIEESTIYDVIIIGAGPAGFTTAIYTSRDGWNTLLIDKGGAGGLISTTHLMENYPGFPDGVDGSELMKKFQAQALRFGAKIVEFEPVETIEKSASPEFSGKPIFVVKTLSGKTIKGKSVLIATGSSPKELGVPGEAEFRNRGVSYCATCDGPIYKGKDVVVVGCGNTGLQETEYLLMYVKSVTLLAHHEKVKAEKIHQERVLNHPKIRCMFNYELIEIKGDQRIKSVLVKDKKKNEILEIPADAVFIYVGYRPATEFLRGLLALDNSGHIITDEKMRTSVEGIFAAGDVRANNPAQAAIAVGDGARAALAIREYLQTFHN